MADHGFKPFFGQPTAEFIKSLRPRGAATTQLVQDPAPTVQFRRRDPDTSRFQDHGEPVELIKISFANRDVVTAGQNTGVVTQRAIGELKAFAPVDLKEGDRFALGEKTCEVMHVYPVSNKQVRATIELIPAGSGVRP